ncbi:hypothetical protein [Clostridium sp. HCS.1]|uniref:hypothetical protein n=1 Tax=Clostridium sp. HCS.1 TaxID=3238594 RepID=UPI003A101435
MIASRADIIIRKIDDLENEKDRKIKLEKYKTLNNNLQNLSFKLSKLIEVKYVLGKNIENVSLKKFSKLLEETKVNIINYNINDRESAFLNSALDGVESELKNEWQKHYNIKIGNIIHTMSNVKPFFSDESEIETIINNLKAFEKKWPINRENYNKFEELINLSKVKINSLELNEDINRFILKITNNSATIADLTPNILKWIKDNRYESKIKLKFK